MSFSTTTKYALRYPNLNQAADFNVIISDLANDLDAIIVGFGQGVIGSRPAAGKSGRVYYDTGNNILYYDDGSTWHSVGALGTGSVTSAMILDGTIVAADIANDTITAAQIAANAITASELADNAVDTAAIAADAVTSPKIAANTIVAADISLTAAIAFTQLEHLPLRGPNDSTQYRIQFVTGPDGNTNPYDVTYPIAFSGIPIIIPAIHNEAGQNGLAPVDINTITNAGFHVPNGGASGTQFHWIAIGPA